MNSRVTKASLLLGLLFFLLAQPQFVAAKGLDLVNFILTPKTPGAHEKVQIRMESFVVDLNTANIAWYVNKVKVEEGIALKDQTVMTGDFGEKLIVDIEILTMRGEIFNKQVVIAPAEVDLLWEAQTYTPPFYKGKALATFKSNVRVTAIPRFNTLTSDPKQYYYKWTYSRNLGVGEALGKNSVVVPMGYANTPLPIMVNVTLPGTEWSGLKSSTIPGTEAKVVLYQQAPLLGIQFNNAWSEKISTNESEFVVYAAPYFFSLDDLMNNRLVYTWEVNRRYTSPGLDARYLTIPKPSGPNGGVLSTPVNSNVSFKVQNPSRILQSGYSQATLTFTP